MPRDPTTWTWLTFGVLQVILVAFSVALLLGRPREHDGLRAALVMGIGALLLTVNALWFWTGGPEGRSPIAMRGGMLGARLSMLTAIEVMLLGVLLLTRSRRRGPG